MLHHLPQVLTQHHLEQINRLLENAEFIDGKLSAGDIARQGKNNLELKNDKVNVQQLNNILMEHLVRHAIYGKAAFAARIATPIYAKYCKGMAYADHVDNPIMGHGQHYRCDIAITLFLNGPEDYDGGHLVVQNQYGEQKIKLPAGDAIMYPASSLHRVEEITRGQRLVAITWVQSMIRSAEHRSILVDLCEARDELLRNKSDIELIKKIDRTYVNLVRMWADV